MQPQALIDSLAPTFDRCTLRDNHAFGGAGGASPLSLSLDLRVLRSHFYRNRAALDGGAVFLENMGTTSTIEASTFINNTCVTRRWRGVV